MKNYFSFTLTAKKLLPIWLLFLVFFMVPYVTMILKMKEIQSAESPSLLILPLIIVLVIIAFVLHFYITKLTIENMVYKDKSIEFTGTFGGFIGIVLLGFFLSIITLGIYTPWFIRDLNRFFIDHSSYNSQMFKFQGKGGKLFVILLLTLFLPIIILTSVLVSFAINHAGQMGNYMIIQQVVTIILMIPYLYFVYKWMINIDYKNLNIRWETNFWSACGKISAEIILIVITAGIYMPLAMLRLYKYFSEKTVAIAEDRKLRFGFDIDQLNDFLFIWGQTLLIIITLGIYYPWAFCKIASRISSKTYLE
jgi:uncharacterized membrane protein YjgN (DUF898 family)